MSQFFKKTIQTTLVIFGCTFLVQSCAKKKDVVAEEPSPTTPVSPTNPAPGGLPVERNSANANYSPAFAGQTRIAGVITATRIRSTILTSALTAPWGIAALPDGRFLVTEKAGSVYYWDPVVSPSGMTFYSSDRIQEWRNNLFIGALSGMHIIRLVIENNTVIGEERLLATESQRFRDITQGIDGAMYAITDQGRLYKIDRE